MHREILMVPSVNPSGTPYNGMGEDMVTNRHKHVQSQEQTTLKWDIAIWLTESMKVQQKKDGTFTSLKNHLAF